MKENSYLLNGIREKQETNKINPCPRCGGNALRIPLVFNPVSKIDNKTYICPSCSTDEAYKPSYEYFKTEDWWILGVNKIQSE